MLKKGNMAIQGVVKVSTINKLDYLAINDLTTRSKIVSKIIEEYIDEYMPEGYELTDIFKKIVNKNKVE